MGGGARVKLRYRPCRQAYIQPVPKVPAPTTHADFRPISITPVLTRIFEKIIVRRYIYPALLAPPPTLTFHDQFAFRPTGSTTAALVSILHAITSLLTANSYVIVIALDFSKAFDTVRHSAVLQKLAQLDIPDHIFNWISDYLQAYRRGSIYKVGGPDAERRRCQRDRERSERRGQKPLSTFHLEIVKFCLL